MASNHPEHEAPEKRVDAVQVVTVKDDKGDAMQVERVEPDFDAGDKNRDAALEYQPRYQPGDEEAPWYFRLLYKTKLEIFSKKDAAWFPVRALHYAVGKDSCKIKIHYTGYPKKFDEMIELWAHPSASSSAVDPDAVQATRLRLPTDCAEVRELSGNITEPEGVWDLGPKSKPYALTAAMKEVAMTGVPLVVKAGIGRQQLLRWVLGEYEVKVVSLMDEQSYGNIERSHQEDAMRAVFNCTVSCLVLNSMGRDLTSMFQRFQDGATLFDANGPYDLKRPSLTSQLLA
ncbi:hypothetical protein HDU96_008542 [Phlyctochytrium bullatum]|nr:hypothetical protein HDU96_008542 [Phlyctochytrium bullatum]